MSRVETLLQICESGTPSELKSFLTQDLLINEPRATDGKTPLHLICDREQEATALQMLDIIFHFGVELIARDHNGDTPLHLAARRGHKTLSMVLRELGADPYLKNNLGQRA